MKVGICKMCGREFRSPVAAQLHCSTCSDIKTHQPTIAVTHETLGQWPVVLGFSPKWVYHGPLYGWSWMHKGREYGASWRGRFDLHAPTDAWKQWARVWLQQKQSTHLVRIRTEERRRNDYDAGTVVDYTVTARLSIAHGISREQRLAWAEAVRAGEFQPVELDDGSLITTERRRYYVLLRTHAEPTFRMVAVGEGYKYTLKGYGAEWRISTDWPDNTIALERVSGGFRSGRYSYTTNYALIPTDANIVQTRHYTSGSGKSSVQRRIIGAEVTNWEEVTE